MNTIQNAMQTVNTPWIHWLAGICLENKHDSQAAEEEYAVCLGLAADNADNVDNGAMVERAPTLLDAAVRLARLKAAAAKSAKDAETAAAILANLALSTENAGLARPQLDYDWAEALRKAYGLKVAEEQRNIHDVKGRIARALLEQDGGTKEDQDLFKQADLAYQRDDCESRLWGHNPSLLERRFRPGRTLSQSRHNSSG